MLGITDHRGVASHEAQVAFLAGNPHEAIALYEQEIAYRKDIGATRSYGFIPSDMAAIYLTLGDDTVAGSLARRALEGMSFESQWLGTALSLIQHLAAVAARSAKPVIAARLLGFTDAGYEREGGFRDPYERASYDILIASLREQLPADEIERYAAEGAQLDLRQATDLALSVVSEDYAE